MSSPTSEEQQASRFGADNYQAFRPPGSRRYVCPLVIAVLVLCCFRFVWALGSAPEKPGEVLLGNGKSLKESGWRAPFSAAKNSKVEGTWEVQVIDKQAVLICKGKGKPLGYIRTLKEYGDFEFELEWWYPGDPNCNSGILVHTTGPDKIWPKSIQVQLHRPMAGSIFPTGGAKTANTTIVKDLDLPVQKWHKCRIRSEQGKITVYINDKKVGEVTGCVPQKGSIALQSEGSEIHFRGLKLTPLKANEKAALGVGS